MACSCSLYTDRGSHYFHTPEAGGKVSSTVETQVGRALAHLGIEHIGACSPQAPLRQAQGTLPGRSGLPTTVRTGPSRVPTAPKPGAVLGAVKDKPCRARLRASLTAPARDASSAAQAGTRKRPPSRTRKRADPNPAIDAA